MNAAMRAAFTCMGFSAKASRGLTDDQGIDSIEELVLLTDNDVTTLCKTIRHPGGMAAEGDQIKVHRCQ